MYNFKSRKRISNMEYDNSLIFYSYNIYKKLEEYYNKFLFKYR